MDGVLETAIGLGLVLTVLNCVARSPEETKKAEAENPKARAKTHHELMRDSTFLDEVHQDFVPEPTSGHGQLRTVTDWN